jgi:hypothetical protein
MKASTSGSGLSSARARSSACEMFSSDRKKNRYAFLSSATVSSANPLRWSPTELSP